MVMHKTEATKMKQWRLAAVGFSLVVLLLVANFSIQFRKRSKRGKAQENQGKSIVIDKVSTSAGPETINTSSVENAKMIPNSDCRKTEETQRLAECVHCSDYEKKSIKGCLQTGNIQLTYCVTSNIKFYGSCRHIAQWEEKKFWMFQGIVFVMLIVSSSAVWLRQRQLDSVFYQKVQKQVESETI
ncbi:unnamed protein product [Pocillopora meandrina]|uniref:Protein JTB n=1 Tax=Pocillopora meandrina TaxID=46732 RepID=A0AAU9X7C5_9CNID|nr:unnamed protein product [Pocillopora meandrina]